MLQLFCLSAYLLNWLLLNYTFRKNFMQIKEVGHYLILNFIPVFQQVLLLAIFVFLIIIRCKALLDNLSVNKEKIINKIFFIKEKEKESND